jgi:hypothetical protein
MNIIPPNQILQDSGRRLRSHRLSPNQYQKFGKVKKRIDAPHYKKDLAQLYPYVDKTLNVSVVEEKPIIEIIKENFQKEIIDKK